MIKNVAPGGCRRCGLPQRDHGTWYTVTGKHTFEPPTQTQIRDRMRSRGISGGRAMTCNECPPQVTCGSVTCTVRRSLYNYPTLHKNRTDVLHYLFCEIGNGYKWADDGCLREIVYKVYPDEYGLKGVQPDPDEDFVDEFRTSRPERYAKMRAVKDAERAELAKIRDNVDELARTKGAPLTVKVDDESREYARLYTMPANVMPDWKAAAAEIRAVVEPVWAARREEEAAIEAAPSMADRLNAAADLIETRAKQATDGPWWRPLDVRNKAVILAEMPPGASVEEGGDEIPRWKGAHNPSTDRRESVGVLEVNTWSDGRHYRSRSGRDLEWAAMMNPLVGPPLAALLRREAYRIGHMFKKAQVAQVSPELAEIADVVLASNDNRPPSR